MTVHFICRGNALRSLIAEAYLNSLKIKNVQVLSSGTSAGRYREINKGNYKNTMALLRKHGLETFAKSHYGDQLEKRHQIEGDIVICMNQIVRDECDEFGKLPASTFVWDVTDVGEKGRIPTTEKERETYAEDVYQEIVMNVDELVHSSTPSGQ